MKNRTTASVSVLLVVSVVAVVAFQPPSPEPRRSRKFRPSTIVEGASGGWGIGNAREMVPEEFAKGDRQAFEGYKLTDRGEFMRKIQDDQNQMQASELDELLGVAKIAGINVKNPSDRLRKFDSELLEGDTEDDLDLSV